MTPYLDFTFLARLLFHERASRQAVETLSTFPPPFRLNGLHVLQVENFARQAEDQDARAVPLVKRGLGWWRNYQTELVFVMEHVEWKPVYARAIAITRETSGWHGNPSATLHLAAAELAGATHLLSFDKRQRTLAAGRGFTVLPETIA